MAMRVLVAEDDPRLSSTLERGLRAGGYVLDAVADGEQALCLLSTFEYDVAVLDWWIPVVSGLEVVRALRRRGSRVCVLMLTDHDAAGDRVTGLDAGADDCLVKPFDLGELLARVRALQRRCAAPRTALGRLDGPE